MYLYRMQKAETRTAQLQEQKEQMQQQYAEAKRAANAHWRAHRFDECLQQLDKARASAPARRTPRPAPTRPAASLPACVQVISIADSDVLRRYRARCHAKLESRGDYRAHAAALQARRAARRPPTRRASG